MAMELFPRVMLRVFFMLHWEADRVLIRSLNRDDVIFHGRENMNTRRD